MGIFSRSTARRGRNDKYNNHNNHNNHNSRNEYNGQPEYVGNTGRTGVTNGSVTDSSITNNDYDHERHGRRSRRLGKNSVGEKSHRDKAPREKRPMFDINSGHFNRRPSFGQWIKFTWLDILTMIIMGAIGLGVYMADPAPSRSFPVTFVGGSGDVVYPQFAYPLRNEIIPIWAAALIAALVPIFLFLVMQIRIKSFWDVNNAVIGLLYSLIGAAVFQVFVKWLIGGLRPHFLAVCQPDLARVNGGGDGFRNLMWKSDICTGDRNQINDALESMPSGHSTAAFAGLMFLYFYLNGKLKVFSNHHPAMWKLIALYAPVLGACLIAGALTIDEFHNWYDCLAGAVIGTVFAISSYRMVYASVWDFRFNHIPLTRHTPFSYGAGAAGAGGFESCVFTHKAGWGYEEAYGGAPFDSAFALRGMNGGIHSSNEHSIGLGDKNTGHRHGDVEHNAIGAGTTTTTGGLGHHNNHGLGHHNRHDNYNTTATTGSGLTGPIEARDNTYNHNNTNVMGSTPIHNSATYDTNTTSGLSGITTNRDHNRGVYDNVNSTGNTHTGGLLHNNNNPTTHTGGLLHHNNNTTTHSGGLLHNNNNPTTHSGGLLHNNNNPNTTYTSTRDNDFTHSNDLPREGRSDTIGGNRYQTHRKSLERKAIVNSGRDGVY